MKNILFFIVLVIVGITGTSIVLTQNTLASSTHITLHNLTNETAELWAEIPVDPPHCDALPNLTCEAGTEYIWYTIQVAIPNSESPTWEQELSGVFGECDVYITGSDGKYDAQHHCSLAKKLDLKPSADNKTK